MASYAVLDENNVVVNVIGGRDETEVVDGISDWEAYYSEVLGQTCKRTSFNTRGGVHLLGGEPFRMNFAEVGGDYDPDADAFVPPLPYTSWTLDTSTYTWVAPSPAPDVEVKAWDEDLLSWMVWDNDTDDWVQYSE